MESDQCAYMTVALLKCVIPGREKALVARSKASFRSRLLTPWWRRIRDRATVAMVVESLGRWVMWGVDG